VSHVATQLQQEYETKCFELPSKEVLLRQLQKSLAAAKELSTERRPRHDRDTKSRIERKEALKDC